MKSSETIAQPNAGGISRLVFLTACLVLMVAACGQKGPLYLPQKDAGGASAAAASSPAEPAAGVTESPADESEDEETNEETP